MTRHLVPFLLVLVLLVPLAPRVAAQAVLLRSPASLQVERAAPIHDTRLVRVFALFDSNDDRTAGAARLDAYRAQQAAEPGL